MWLITSNQSFASSNGVIIFTGGDYIYLEIRIKYLYLSLVLRWEGCATALLGYWLLTC